MNCLCGWEPSKKARLVGHILFAHMGKWFGKYDPRALLFFWIIKEV